MNSLAEIPAPSSDGDLPLAAFVPDLAAIGRGGLHIARGLVSWRGKAIRLPRRHVAVVTALASAPRAITAQQIVGAMYWPGFVVSDDKSLARKVVSRIRRRFEAVDPEFDQIETHPGIGYSWR
jgi:two-component system, OmpR family, response regulator ChvI